MAQTSTIEWTDATWNPIRGCTRISPGCGGPGPHGGCYAEWIAARFSKPGQAYEGLAEMRGGKPRWTGKLAFVEDALTSPLRRRKPTTYFVNSMSDLFHERVPQEWIDRIFAVMALCPQHTFQVLTKRSARMREYLTIDRRHAVSKQANAIADAATDIFKARAAVKASGAPVGRIGDPLSDRWPLPNVWLGVSAEDQQRADERVPDLLATPAAVRFVSAEPLLGPIDFMSINRPTPLGSMSALPCEPGGTYLDWVIVGGESGPNAHPMHPQWARDIRDQCAAAEVPFFFKQWGEYGTSSVIMTTGLPVFREFRDHQHWVNKASTWVRGGICIDRQGRILRNGADFARARDEGAFPATIMDRVGKKAAGRCLDGVEHNGMPEARA